VPGTVDCVLQFLGDELGKWVFGPFKDTDANIRTVKWRSMVYAIFGLVDLLLGVGVTALEAYKLVVPWLADDGLLEVCEPLVEFLTVALAKSSATRDTPINVQHQGGVSGYVSSPAVISFRWEIILYRDLSGLHQALLATPGDPLMLHIARSVRHFIAEASDDRIDWAEARELAHRSCSIRDRIGDVIVDRMLLLYRATEDEEMPPIYHEWAAHPWGVSELWVLQQAVEQACATVNEPDFEVIPAQVMVFKNLWFAGSTYFDIGARFLPFGITPLDGTSRQARTMLAMDWVQVDVFDLVAHPESGAVDPSDIVRLRNMSGYATPLVFRSVQPTVQCSRAHGGRPAGRCTYGASRLCSLLEAV
jgi:hypothetical protein